MHEHADRRPDGGAYQAHARGLDHVDPQGLRRAYPKATQHRHGIDLPLDVHVDGAGDPYAAQQKSDEAHQVQEPGQISEGPTQAALAVLHGVHIQAKRVEARFQRVFHRIQGFRGSVRQFHIPDVAHDRTELNQAGGIQAGQGNEDAWAGDALRHTFTGNREQAAGDQKRDLADFHRIAHIHAELHHQAVVDQGVVALRQCGFGVGGHGFEDAVIRKAAFHGADLRQARVISFREECHRREADFTGLLTAD